MKKSLIIKNWNDIKDSRCAPGLDHLTLSYIEKKKISAKYIEIVFKSLKGKYDYKFCKYKQLLKLKGKGKEPRVVSIPSIRDRLMLKCISDHLSFIDRPKISNLISEINYSICSNKYDSYVKLDISKFYDKIDVDILLNKLSKKLDINVLNLIEKALLTNTVDDKINTKDTSRLKTERKGVPQGIIISNSLAEYYLLNFDCGMRKISNISFFRFVDDIIVFYNSKDYDPNELLKTVTFKLKKIKLQVNKDKFECGKISDSIEFIGYEFFKGKIKPRKSAIQSEEKKLERLIFDFKNAKNLKMKNVKILEWKLNTHINGFMYKKKIYGWVQVYHDVTDATVFYKMDWLLKKLLKRAGLYGKIKTPSFGVSYQYLKNRNITNCVDFSKLYSKAKDKKALLIDLFGINSKTKSDVIESLFHSLVTKTIYDTEKDLDFKYSVN